MNVYDFDKTIYDGDSTVNFYLYCLFRHPKIIRYIPKQIKGIIMYILKKINKTQMKEYFYTFFSSINNIDGEVNNFWYKNKKKIKKWYLEKHKSDDIIISASPYFLLQPICKEIGISKVIASNVDKITGKYQGENCRGQEKVIRFRKEFKNETIDEFYSDSYSDLPVARLATKAYLVNKNKLKIWKVD